MAEPLSSNHWVRCIDELPPNGLKVLAFFKNELGNGRRVLASFIHKFAVPADAWAWDSDTPDDWFDRKDDIDYVPSGWYEEAENTEDMRGFDEEITHWMLLPAPPDETKP